MTSRRTRATRAAAETRRAGETRRRLEAKRKREARRRPKAAVTARSRAFFEAKKLGLTGKGSEITCATCGVTYAAFRSGFTFADARREFITDEPNRRTGKRMHGRLSGVLGKLREWKQLAWKAHVEECATSAKKKGRAA